jgi:hypothetical protein
MIIEDKVKIMQEMLPLEIHCKDVSILITDCELDRLDRFNCKYYITDKDNVIPYNEKNPEANYIVEEIFNNLFYKSASD